MPRRSSSPVGGRRRSRYSTLFSPLQPSEENLVAGLRLFEREEALGAFEAVLAATAIASKADALVSADRSFAEARGLHWVDLAGDELEALLAG